MSTYLMHHGIKGQKWGIRRYQNEDGSLTDAGRARYGGQREYNESGLRNLVSGNTAATTLTTGGLRGIRENRANKLERKSKMYEYRSTHTITGKERTSEKWAEKAKKTAAKAEAQKAKNANIEAYNKHTSTGKMMAQNLLMGIGADSYRAARARGDSRAKAAVEGMLGWSIPGQMITAHRDKKAYGAAAWSDI